MSDPRPAAQDVVTVGTAAVVTIGEKRYACTGGTRNLDTGAVYLTARIAAEDMPHALAAIWGSTGANVQFHDVEFLDGAAHAVVVRGEVEQCSPRAYNLRLWLQEAATVRKGTA